MAKDPSQKMFDDIMSDSTYYHELETFAMAGPTQEERTKAIIARVLELRGYPASERMRKLMDLRQYTMSPYMEDYNNSRLARRVIASELLELDCLPVELRIQTMTQLGEAFEPDESYLARMIWRDAVTLAKLHRCESAASSAARHLEPVSR